MGNATSLGQARGEILFTTNIQDVLAQIQQGAKAITAAMQAANGGGANTNAAQSVSAFAAAAKSVQQATQATAQAQNAVNSQLGAAQNIEQSRLNVAQQQLETIAQTGFLTQRLAQEEARRAQFTRDAERSESEIARLRASTLNQGTQRTGLDNRGNPNIPTFLGFAPLPFASLAGQLGATGLSTSLYGLGNILGIADAINPMLNAFARLSERLKETSGIIGTLANAGASIAGVFGTTAAAMGAVVAVAVPFVAAFAAIGLVVTSLQQTAERAAKKAEEAKQRMEAAIEGQGQIADLLTGGATSADAQRTVDERDRGLDYLDTVAAQVEAIFSPSLRPIGSSPRDYEAEFAALSEATGITVTNMDEARIAFDILNERIKEGREGVNQLAIAIANGTFAANDAATEQERLEAITSAGTQARIQAEVDITQMTNEQVRERLAANETEKSILLANFDEMSNEEQQSAILRIAAILETNRVYKEALADTERAAKEAAEALVEMAKLTADYASESIQIQADRQRQSLREEEDYGRRRATVITDFAREMIRAEQDFMRSRTRMIEDAARDLARMEAAYLEAQADLIADAQEAQIEAEIDHAKAMEKIVRDGRESMLEAAAQLDAVGVFNARRSMNRALQEEQEQYEEEAAERQEALAEALAELAENYEEQRRLRQEELQRALDDAQFNYDLQQQRRREDFARQLSQMDYERSIRLARLREDHMLEDAQRRYAFNQQIQSLISHNTLLQSIQTAGQNVIRGLWTSFWTGLAASIPSGGGTTTTPAWWGASTDAGRMFSRSVPALAPSYTLGGTSGGNVVIQWSGDVVTGDLGSHSLGDIRRIVKDTLNDGVLDEGLGLVFTRANAMRGMGR